MGRFAKPERATALRRFESYSLGQSECERVWLSYLPWKQETAGSNPAAPTMPISTVAVRLSCKQLTGVRFVHGAPMCGSANGKPVDCVSANVGSTPTLHSIPLSFNGRTLDSES